MRDHCRRVKRLKVATTFAKSRGTIKSMQKDAKSRPPSAHAHGEGPCFEIVSGDPDRAVVVLCDHASNFIPKRYNNLSLPDDVFERHIAYDIGAAGVTRRLAKGLKAIAVLGGFSRLLIDPNRGLDDPTLIMRLSDRTIIPGNRTIDPVERQARIEKFHRPYHDAVKQVLDGLVARNRLPILISIHSFTASWSGKPRPWHAAVLSDTDRRIADPLINALREPGDIIVGDNEPYTGALQGDTMWRHGTRRDIPHALIEIRQDLVRDEHGQEKWADRLDKVLTRVISDFRATHHGDAAAMVR